MGTNNITKSMLGEEALILEGFATHSDALIALCRPSGEVVYLNPAGQQLLGLVETHQHGSLQLSDLFHAGDSAVCRDDVLARVHAEGSWTGERRLLHGRTGEEIPVFQNIFKVMTKEGTPLFGMLMRDLRKERELVSRLSLFKKAVESVSEGVVIMDAKLPEHPLIYVNPAFSKITGYRIEESIGRNAHFLQGNEPSPELEELRQGMAKKTHARGLLKNRRKDGTPFWSQLSVSPVKDRHGETTHFVGVQLDVSEERRAKAELLAETQRMQLVLTSIELGVWEWEAGSNEMKWDNQMFALHRVKRSTTPDPMTAWKMRVHPEDLPGVWREIQLALEGKETYISPVRLSLPNGDVRFMRMLARLIRGSGEQPGRLIGVCWDVTREMKSKDIIEDQQMQIQAQARLASLGEMAGGIAHEINNPLSIIAAYVDRLRESIDSGTIDTQEMSRVVNRITLTVHRIAGIIKGLRLVARDGARDPYEVTSARSLVADTLALCSEKCRNIGIDIQVEGDIDTMLECRIVQISQVLTNLLSNAIHAVERGPDKWIRVSAINEESELVFRIADSGTGIPAEIRNRIFEPFFTTKEPGKGTGLGLSISTSILKDHGGSLTLDLSVTSGTTFVIRLPKKQTTRRVA